MSGAWEQQAPEVMVAILTREIVTTKWAMGFRNLSLPGSSGVSFRTGAPYDVMRNSACSDALAAGYQRVMFLDDDVIPPPDTFYRLARHSLDVVSGLYYRRQPPICPVAMTIDHEKKPQWVTQWSPPNSLVEVDLVGAGCLLIHRRVLERISQPWFVWEIGKGKDQPPGRTAMSEDFAFCVKVKEHGFKVHLDTSIQCEHIGLGQSSAVDGSYKPSSI